MKIPVSLKRRHLVEQDLAPAQALAIADAYLEGNRIADALEFLVKADAQDRLSELRRAAIDCGDVFLIRDLSYRLGEEPSAREWRAAADAAQAAGKETYAIEARRLAEALG